MSARMSAEYKATTDRLVAKFGKTRRVDDIYPSDFWCASGRTAEQFGPVRLGNEVQKVRSVFRFGEREANQDGIPVWGAIQETRQAGFAAAQGQNRTEAFRGDRATASYRRSRVPLKAMILPGINAGFGNADCGTLLLSAANLEKGWVIYPRPKTGIEWSCPLWPETVAALRDALADRQEPKQEAHANLVFVTKYGHPWSNGGKSDAVTQETGKLLCKLDIRRAGVGFSMPLVHVSHYSGLD